MVLNLGGFKFNWKQVGNISIMTDFGISSQNRVQNFPALISTNLGNQTINLTGQTLPKQGDRQTALKSLYSLANTRQSYALVNGNGKYYGRFSILKITENQAIFTPQGSFFAQSFTIELQKDYDS